MNEHCRELEVEAFLYKLVPGPNPSERDFKNFKEGLARWSDGMKEWETNLGIVCDSDASYCLPTDGSVYAYSA